MRSLWSQLYKWKTGIIGTKVLDCFVGFFFGLKFSFLIVFLSKGIDSFLKVSLFSCSELCGICSCCAYGWQYLYKIRVAKNVDYCMLICENQEKKGE